MQQKSISLNRTTNEVQTTNRDLGTASIISYLQDFGLNEKEAKIYYILSRLGAASASEISNASQFNRLQTYRSVKGLLDRGLLEISLERPRRYTPLKIDHAISLLQQEAENKILMLENKKPLLLQKWSEIPDFPVSKAAYTFRIIQGSKNVLKFAIMLYESAEKDVGIVLKGNDLMRLMIEGVDDTLQITANKNVIVKTISKFENTNLAGARRFLEFSELHHSTDPNLLPLILIDGKEVLICLTNDANNSVPENAIWTNHPEFVGMLKGFFSFLWANSQDAKLMVEKIEQKGQISDVA
jgi:sugar-specific transcriptional regulator TrmB